MREKEPEDAGDGDGGGWSAVMADAGSDASGHRGPAITTNDVQSMSEMQLTIAASSYGFPGFRFSPTDYELISYYLKKKLEGSDNCVDIIREVDFCRHEPWDLPALSVIRSENEWFFFSARGKKYPNGLQSKRATQSGYWKATGKERDVKSGAVTIGTKRTLVFHTGRAPKGERTEWIMYEYCMSDTAQESLVVCRLRRNSDFRINKSARGSSSNSTLPAPDNSQPGTDDYASNTQMDSFDHDAHAIKSYSKDTSSGYRSLSVEQNDSGSESDRKLIYKQYDYEDDCFAGITNDDIIKLEEPASNFLRFRDVLGEDLTLFVRDPTTCLQNLPRETIKTALGRIRPRHQTGHEKPPSCATRRNADQDPKPSQKNESRCAVGALSRAANFVSIEPVRLILVLMTILLFVAWLGHRLHSCSKQHLGFSIEGSRTQLRYWLRKAADYI